MPPFPFQSTRHLGATLTLLCSAAISTAAFAQATPKVLVLGDVNVGAGASAPYADAAYNEMVTTVLAAGGSVSNVTRKNFNIAAAGGTPALTDQDFTPAGGGKYDLVVLTAVWGGLDAASVAALNKAIANRTANAFFLFPDECSSCAKNIDTITLPVVNAATGWGITKGLLFNNSVIANNIALAGTAQLNANTPLAASFDGSTSGTQSLNPMTVWDYRALDNVPAYNVLYTPNPSAGDPPGVSVPMPSAADVQNGKRVDNASALIVPSAQSYGGKGACIFTISDVNPLTLPGNPPLGKMGSIMLHAATSATGSCATPSGAVQISKTLAAPPTGASISWPLNIQFGLTCDLPAAGTSYAVPALAFNAPGTQTTTVSAIPAGANCIVTEQPPAPIANFRWDVSPAAPVNVVIADGLTSAVAFTNTLVPTTGEIALTKNLAALPAGAPVTLPLAFNFTATCNLPSAGTVYNATATFSAPGSQTVTIPNVPESAVCSLAEVPVSAPATYTWDTAVFAPASVTIAAGQTVSSAISNRLQTIPPALGTLSITKTLAPLPSGAPVTWPMSFSFTALCDKPSANSPYSTNLSFNATGSQTAQIATIPAGAQCTVTETLPTAPTGFTWDTPVFAPSAVAIGGGQTTSTSVTNTLRANAAPATTATPVPSSTAAGLAALTVLLAALAMRQRQRQRPQRTTRGRST